MTLRLTIISPPNVPPGFDQSFVLDGGAASIGRSPENDFVLADPSRQLSKRHCTVTVAGGAVTLTDTSSNGVFINGSPQRVPRDQSVAITAGDVLKIGDYQLKVETEAAAQPVAGPVFGDDDFAGDEGPGGYVPPLPDEEDPRPDDEFDLGFALSDDGDDNLGMTSANPFADAARLLRETAIRRSAGFDDDSAGSSGDSGESLLPHGPEGTLYAKAPGTLRREQPRDEPEVSLNPFGDDDDDGDWDEPPMPDNVPSEQAQFTPPTSGPTPASPSGDDGNDLIPDDWDLDDDSGGSPFQDPEPSASPFLDPTPEPSRPQPAPAAPPAPTPRPTPALTPAPAPAPAPTPPAPPPQQPTPAGGVADSAAMRAFLTGAGLGSMRLTESQAVQLMADAGQVFRALVAGLQEALATRAEIKEELDLSRTMVGATSNNPLKLDLSVDEGVVAMLRQPGPGFLAPVDAVNEGYRDVQAHQMATMAAMHLALRRLLEKFDPETLSRRLDESSLLNSLMPGARKSKYWEVYCDFYASIAGDAESEFHEFFTKEFSKAYEEQARKLK